MTNDLLSAIKEAVKAHEWEFEHLGLRVHHSGKSLTAGQKAPKSYRWVDGNRTNTRLAGTCALEIRKASDVDAISELVDGYARNPNSQVMLIGCNDRPTQGEDQREVIMSNAVVIEVFA